MEAPKLGDKGSKAKIMTFGPLSVTTPYTNTVTHPHVSLVPRESRWRETERAIPDSVGRGRRSIGGRPTSATSEIGLLVRPKENVKNEIGQWKREREVSLPLPK